MEKIWGMPPKVYLPLLGIGLGLLVVLLVVDAMTLSPEAERDRRIEARQEEKCREYITAYDAAEKRGDREEQVVIGELIVIGRCNFFETETWGEFADWFETFAEERAAER